MVRKNTRDEFNEQTCILKIASTVFVVDCVIVGGRLRSAVDMRRGGGVCAGAPGGRALRHLRGGARQGPLPERHLHPAEGHSDTGKSVVWAASETGS